MTMAVAMTVRSFHVRVGLLVGRIVIRNLILIAIFVISLMNFVTICIMVVISIYLKIVVMGFKRPRHACCNKRHADNCEEKGLFHAILYTVIVARLTRYKH